MTEEASWYSQLGTEAAAEAGLIVRAFREHGIQIGGVPDPADQDDDVTPNGVGFMYAEDHLLTREQFLGGARGAKDPGSPDAEDAPRPIEDAPGPIGVLDILRRYGYVNPEITRVVRDVVLIRLNPGAKGTPGSDEGSRESNDAAADGNGENPEGSSRGNDGTSEGNGETTEGDQYGVLFLLDRIDEELGVGIATPDHVLTAANGLMGPCAATEPEEFYGPQEPYPPVCRGDGGARVRVFIADTGLLHGAAETIPWLHGVKGGTDPRTGADGTILPYAGHGTFVAGVLRCMAPGAQVHVANIFDIAGSALESHFVRRLNAAFDFGFEVLHLTASCMTRKNVQLIALEAWLELLRPYKGVVCVAPAGNNHTRRPSWPGAFPGVISVGAIGTGRRSRAYFSDYGGWVNVYTLGQNLINAYASGTYICQIPPFKGQERTFSGLAQWSGTSFSAPIVTGMIAARMARCGESAQEAAAHLLARARAQTIPGVGPVLLPCCEDADGEGCGHHRGGHGGGCGCGHGRGGHSGCGCGGGDGRGGGCGCADGRGGCGGVTRRGCGCRDR